MQTQIPMPANETVLEYAPGDQARTELQAKLKELRANPVKIPLIIAGKEIFTDDTEPFAEPHKHSSVLAHCSQADAQTARAAIQAALAARAEWEATPLLERAKVFLKAADLLAGKYRATVNAATMLGQSKTAHQAEIDAACELIDFLRFNCHFAERLYQEQPISVEGMQNSMEHRGLEGFVFAITPFNFTAIAGNLPSAPAIMGNVAVWKPSRTAVLSNYIVMQVFQEAGLPDGVINFLPGPAGDIASTILTHPELAGVHFTGSTGVFQNIWKTIGNNIANYRSYPRIVGETGGKDFLVAHPSANPVEVATALVRGAFEYQGQKCSAASRAYLPRSLWNSIRSEMEKQLAEVKMGDPCDFSNFVSAVIDEKSFDNIAGYIDRAKKSDECEIIFGGEYDKSEGYFVRPTVIETSNPNYESMEEEIFGPVLTLFIYEDSEFSQTLQLVDKTSPYALTGAIMSQDRAAVDEARKVLRFAAGNFYINDKPTGSVVGQQPFGGARASGTNDKAGSILNLVRWANPLTIKETFDPPKHFSYPFLQKD